MGRDPFVVGVDVGSSSSRAIALGRDGRVLDRSTVVHRFESSHRSGEVDPGIWRTSAVEAIAAVGGSAAAIGLGGYGPTTVASGGELALTFRYAGGDIGDPQDQHQAHAAELGRRYGPEGAPLLLWDWLAAELGAPHGRQSVWPGDEPIPGFGEPSPVGAAVTVTAAGSGLDAGIPLVPATNDGYLTAWAAGIDRPGRGFDPGGSTGGLGVAVAGTGPAAPYGIPSAVPGVLIAGGPTASHGAMLDWWAMTTGTSPDELLRRAVDEPVGSDGVFVLPFLEGERAPRWNAALRADIIGLRPHHGPGTVARAILECTAYGLAHIARSLADQGIGLERLVVCGATARNPLWVETKAAVLGVPVEVPAEREMAAYGAALAAGAALEWWPRPGEGASGDWPLTAFSVVEAAPVAVHQERFEEFVQLGDAAERRLP